MILVKTSWDTGERSRILVNPVLILVKTSGILVKVVWDTGKSSFNTVQVVWDTRKSSLGYWSRSSFVYWSSGSRILVNPVLILVKTSGILVSGLGYW